MSADARFLVSGGSGGIGAAVCQQLAGHGLRPVVAYHRNRDAAEEVAARCGGETLPLDLGADTSIAAAVAWLEDSALPLAGVVLAGSPPPTLAPFGQIAHHDMQLQWQINVAGPQVLLAELVRRCFRKRREGTVVGVLSRAMGGQGGQGGLGEHGGRAASGMGAYVIAKHGMAGMLALLAADYPWLRVRTVSPGYTETRMLEAFDERFLALQRERQAFQTAEQVAALIVQEALAA